ncbi:unnamed protein product [Echinostoma caproni]|uniref:Uncharacterized protein n=1 Tax=Echinostoma caproni TaxID=27848 RepID=A0A183BDW1_9TREM|nr:unnamed protein product [Echinostoma caproni]
MDPVLVNGVVSDSVEKPSSATSVESSSTVPTSDTTTAGVGTPSGLGPSYGKSICAESTVCSSDDHLFRHPSSAPNDFLSVRTELHARQPLQTPSKEEKATTIADIVQLDPNPINSDPPLITTSSKPTVWCLPPALSDECRRAMAGGAPNPAFNPAPTREGPVTKHIRLTAALTLKNMLRFTQFARKSGFQLATDLSPNINGTFLCTTNELESKFMVDICFPYL